MKTLLPKLEQEVSSRRRYPEAKPGSMDNNCGIYGQDYFLEMLCLERKRAERSGETMLVMLLDIRKAFPSDKPGQLMNVLADGVALTIRDIDICGWLSYQSVIGVIFTEIAHDNVNAAIDIIDKKLHDMLFKLLPSDVARSIKKSFHVFPESVTGGKNEVPLDVLFYPEINGSGKSIMSGLLKRFIDIVGSLAALALFLPLFVVIPVLIKLTSRGPVLYKQDRFGRYGKKFVFMKFRSMYVNNNDSIHREYIKKFITKQGIQTAGNNKMTEEIFKIRDDPRVTPLGKFLRRTSLDEFPQFINVLKGEMSLVGPRPPIPYELENYNAWHRYRLFGTKPGITGLWQVKGRSKTTFDDMVRLDIEYIRNWSIWLDFKIILQTPLAVLTGKGAY